MEAKSIMLGGAVCHRDDQLAKSEFVEIAGEPFVCIRHVDALDPFFMSVVSDSDHWLFLGSNTPFTAGRVDADNALFPYQTVDKLISHADTCGALSIFLVKRGEQWFLWEPWRESSHVYRVERHLYKHIYGTSVLFEEINTDLGLRFRWGLTASEPYGFVRECSLENFGRDPVDVRYLDGWHHLLPPGVSQDTFTQFSYLAAAYMRHECLPAQSLGVYTLNAGMSDRAEPCESLRAACAWSLGHAHPSVLLCGRQVEAFRRGDTVRAETEVRGEFGAYLVADSVAVPPGKPHTWFAVADTRLDHAALIHLQRELERPARLEQSLRKSLKANQEGVRRRIAGADGLQQTADRATSVHHFANVLFNCMRGGTLNDSYRFPVADFASFVLAHNKVVHARHRDWLDRLPATLTLEQLHQEAARRNDAQLSRLSREYLPVTFSRRHGDPSRPWNRFSIHIKDDQGNPLYAYQGNWRDIFQNWESLAQSYPAYLGQMISVFLNSSTADGYNPYRISRNGVDWEVEDPRHPWSYIGYWGDHQIIYLLRLLESYERFYPGRLADKLNENAFTYAHVPYEIADFDALLVDPRNTVTFNHTLHERLLARAGELGADGRMLANDKGEIALVPLAEKLLVPLLAKLSNFVPEGGVWLNTQRPEWNDANNALAGWGLSMVTVNYMRRYMVFVDGILSTSKAQTVELSSPVADFLKEITGTLRAASEQAKRGFDDANRFNVLAGLGRAGATYRQRLYKQGLDGRTAVPLSVLRDLMATALPVIEATIHASRRDDALYDGYNVLHIQDNCRAGVAHLNPMLEGQVAVLSSGLLKAEDVLAVVRALRASALYRADQRSYMLYPDRVLPAFLARNVLPADAAKKAPLLAQLAAAGDHSLVVVDDLETLHFQADLRNAAELVARLDRLAQNPKWQEAVTRDRGTILEVWEAVFHHSEFTGRSGTFFAFEGLGSIYWHMVAKLLLAVQECHNQAIRDGLGSDVISPLSAGYDELRSGLGFRKTPTEYGAFPTDPYSHTPRHRGAQQPGMTGQVKEEILTRWGELGIEIEKGQIRFAPRLLRRAEFFKEPHRFTYIDLHGKEKTWDLAVDCIGFTYCQVPICYQLADTAQIQIEWADGHREMIRSNTLNPESSKSVFERTGAISRLNVFVEGKSLK